MRTKWISYNNTLVPNCYPHEEPDTSELKINLKKTKGALFARYTTDFDCNYETPFWAVIKDTPFDINSLKAKRRYEINRGNKSFYTKPLSRKNLGDMYDVYVESMKGYDNPVIVAEDVFLRNWDNVFTVKETLMLGVFECSTDFLCGWAHIIDHGRYIPISTFDTRVSYEKNGVNFALAFGICEYYKSRLESGSVYLCDGYRNIIHQTKFQDFLIKYFGFRKAYCNLHMVYRSSVLIAVKLFYPFRKGIKAFLPKSLRVKVCAVLNMEEWSRKCQQLKKSKKTK